MLDLVRRLITLHPALTFAVMATSFAAFSLLTANVFHLLAANLEFIARDGVMALMEGAAAQLGEILASILTALLFYVLFKACERILVERLTRP